MSNAALSEGILTDPVPSGLHALLRLAVLDHARSERRKHYLPLVHVGRPGASQTLFAVRTEDGADHALRTDVVAAMVRRATPGAGTPMVWLTRSGELDLQDVDAAWLAAARTAYAEAELPLTMVVVNRRGWRDPRSGVGRTWSRLRG
jgi:hypothetical protein